MFRIGVSVLVLAGVFACGVAKAVSSAFLEWDLNTDPSVVGYNVYYGGASRDYTNVVSVGNSTNTEIQGLLEGQTYYFAVTVYDAFGQESDFSAETTFIVPGFLTLTAGTDPSEPLHIRFPVEPSHWYELQTSEDLVNWSTTWQVVGTSNVWVQYDAPPTNPAPQFFRIVLH